MINLFSFFFFLFFAAKCLADSGQEIMSNTRISINSDGERIFLYWKGDQSQWLAKIVEIKSGLSSKIDLPPKSIPFTFSYDDSEILYLLPSKKYEIRAIGIAKPSDRLLFRTTTDISFLSEPRRGRYVFLSTLPSSRYAIWMDYFYGNIAKLSEKRYGYATLPNFTPFGDFLLIPGDGINNPRFDIFSGYIPGSIINFVNKNTGLLRCAKSTEIICVRADHFVDLKEVYSEIHFIFPNGECKLPGKWSNLNEVKISDNGKFIIFLASYGNKNRIFKATTGNTCSHKLIF